LDYHPCHRFLFRVGKCRALSYACQRFDGFFLFLSSSLFLSSLRPVCAYMLNFGLDEIDRLSHRMSARSVGCAIFCIGSYTVDNKDRQAGITLSCVNLMLNDQSLGGSLTFSVRNHISLIVAVISVAMPSLGLWALPSTCWLTSDYMDSKSKSGRQTV
jgi:hypothetical protein